MYLSQIEQKKASRDFVITPYYADDTGRMKAQIPLEGPCRGLDECPCRVCVDYLRERKTGPEHALVVVYCKTHDKAFTLYPPGYVPYGREPIVGIAPDGNPLSQEDEAEQSSVHNVFEGTCFQASLDAAQGIYWNPYHPQYAHKGANQWWSTQRRRLDKSVRWLGLDSCSQGRLRESICRALEVDQLLVEETAGYLEVAGGYRREGRSVRVILEALCQGPCLLERLLAAGQVAGFWGRPLRWDKNAGVLRSPVFPYLQNSVFVVPETPRFHPRN